MIRTRAKNLYFSFKKFWLIEIRNSSGDERLIMSEALSLFLSFSPFFSIFSSLRSRTSQDTRNRRKNEFKRNKKNTDKLDNRFAFEQINSVSRMIFENDF